jgi:hypothetical protein
MDEIRSEEFSDLLEVKLKSFAMFFKLGNKI